MYLTGGFSGDLVGREIEQLQEDPELFLALENLIHARAHLPAADYEWSGTDAANGNAFNQVGEHQRAGANLFRIHGGHSDGCFVVVEVSADLVLTHYIQPVGA